MSFPNPNDVANQTKFAAFVGVSQQAISQLKNKNVFPDGGTYAEWLSAYLERLRAEAAGRDQDERLSQVRIRETEMSANLKELDYLERLGKIILVADLSPLVTELFSSIQFNVMSAQERIIEAVESKHAIKLDDDDVGKPLRDALASVADGTREFIGAIASSVGGATADGADADGGVVAEVPEAAS